ncbi:MAG: phosphate acyltransferase, partial [Gammaproteobacteria bacterium]|nr:phosphate acyltransferase [Gammaproteobacteria bacterium]
MDSRITIALDAMGGDFGSSIVVPAAVLAARKNPDVDFILVGDEAEIRAALDKAGSAGDSQLHVQHATQTVEMDELPSHALRNKKDSSMRVALNQIKEG